MVPVEALSRQGDTVSVQRAAGVQGRGRACHGQHWGGGVPGCPDTSAGQKPSRVWMCPRWASGAHPGLWLKLPVSLPLHPHRSEKSPPSSQTPSCLKTATMSFIVPTVWHPVLGLVIVHPDLGFANSSLCIRSIFWKRATGGWVCMLSWGFPRAETIWLPPEEGEDSAVWMVSEPWVCG